MKRRVMLRPSSLPPSRVLNSAARCVSGRLFGSRYRRTFQDAAAAPAAARPAREASPRRPAYPTDRWGIRCPLSARLRTYRNTAAYLRSLIRVGQLAGSAEGAAMCCHTFAHSLGPARFVQGGNIGRRRRWRRSQNILQNPSAAHHRRGAVGIRRHRAKNTPLPQQAEAIVGVGQLDPAGNRCHRLRKCRNVWPAARPQVCNIAVSRSRILPMPRGSRWPAATPSRAASTPADFRRSPKTRHESALCRADFGNCSHCPPKFDATPRSVYRPHAPAQPGVPAPRARATAPSAAAFNSSSSGILLHRKNDSRDARIRIADAVRSAGREIGGVSFGKRDSSARPCSASSMPESKLPSCRPVWYSLMIGCRSASVTGTARHDERHNRMAARHGGFLGRRSGLAAEIAVRLGVSFGTLDLRSRSTVTVSIDNRLVHVRSGSFVGRNGPIAFGTRRPTTLSILMKVTAISCGPPVM